METFKDTDMYDFRVGDLVTYDDEDHIITGQKVNRNWLKLTREKDGYTLWVSYSDVVEENLIKVGFEE